MGNKTAYDPIKLVEDHKPKNFKFKYIITDPSLEEDLIKNGYDISSLDMINDDKLIEQALKCDFREYDRSIIGKAKSATMFDDGSMISKKMVTKADKKLLAVYVGMFGDTLNHFVVKLHYEKFDIIEIFNMI